MDSTSVIFRSHTALLLAAALPDDPPFSLRDGGIIRDGYDQDVDYLRSIMKNGKGWIEEIEIKEREATGIKTMHVGYNKVFGYYIEVSKSQIAQVPDRYIRKQTLANCERYITQELKDMESTILGAADKLTALEFSLFTRVREAVAAAAARIQRAASEIAELDVYLSLAEVASKNNYVCPEVDLSDALVIVGGRHPVVEKFVTDSYFVPNDKNHRDPQFIKAVGKLPEFPHGHTVDPEIHRFPGLGMRQMGVGRSGFGMLTDKSRHIAVVIESGESFLPPLQSGSGIQYFPPDGSAGTVTVQHSNFGGSPLKETGHGSIDFFSKETAADLIPAAFRDAPVRKIQYSVNTFQICNNKNFHFPIPFRLTGCGLFPK